MPNSLATRRAGAGYIRSDKFAVHHRAQSLDDDAAPAADAPAQGQEGGRFKFVLAKLCVLLRT